MTRLLSALLLAAAALPFGSAKGSKGRVPGAYIFEFEQDQVRTHRDYTQFTLIHLRLSMH